MAVCGGGVVAVVGGCADRAGTPSYQNGTARNATGNGTPTNETNRTAEEMTAAESVAITEPDTNAIPVDSLTIESHEYVVKDGYKGPTVQGVVSNTGDEPVRMAEVRVRVYNAAGSQLGQYMARTGDIAADTTWEFEVVLLESASAIAEYDAVVLGVPE